MAAFFWSSQPEYARREHCRGFFTEKTLRLIRMAVKIFQHLASGFTPRCPNDFFGSISKMATLTVSFSARVGLEALAIVPAISLASNLVGGLGLVTLTHIMQAKGAREAES